jgi:site-specific DNA recombinase
VIALIYVRVSTEDQAKRGYSLPEQLSECRQRAKALGAAETIEIVDDVGGDLLERPKMEQTRQLVRAGNIMWFICFDPDRFSRNLLNQLLVTDEIDKAGIELIFIQHQREKTAEGNLFYAIRGAIAEFEKKKILERTQRGKRGKAKQGLLPGYCNPFGYTMDTEADQLVVNEAEARWVRQIFEWASNADPDERIGQYRIAERLNQLGVPAPRGTHWYRSTVAGILRNPLYTGIMKWGQYDHTGIHQARRIGAKPSRKVARAPEQVIELPVPVLVSPAVFGRVHEFIRVDRHRRSRGRTYLLTGIAYCGLCGAHMQTKTTSHRYLVCANRYPGYRDMGVERRSLTRPCGLPHIRAQAVEEYVWATVCEWLNNRAACENTLEAGPAQVGAQAALQRDLELVESQIAEMERAQARVIAFVATAAVKPAIAEQQMQALIERQGALANRRHDLQTRLQSLGAVAKPGAGVRQRMETALQEVRDRLALISDERRTSLVRRLVARVVIAGPQDQHWAVLPLCLSPTTASL